MTIFGRIRKDLCLTGGPLHTRRGSARLVIVSFVQLIGTANRAEAEVRARPLALSPITQTFSTEITRTCSSGASLQLSVAGWMVVRFCISFPLRATSAVHPLGAVEVAGMPETYPFGL